MTNPTQLIEQLVGALEGQCEFSEAAGFPTVTARAASAFARAYLEQPTEPAPSTAGEREKIIADALEHADSLRVAMQDQAAETIESLCALLQSPALPVGDLTADMFWNHDDAEQLYSSIEEFLNDEICNGLPLEVCNTRTIQRAVRLPNIEIRVTSIDEESCEAEYEVVQAAHGITQGGKA